MLVFLRRKNEKGEELCPLHIRRSDAPIAYWPPMHSEAIRDKAIPRRVGTPFTLARMARNAYIRVGWYQGVDIVRLPGWYQSGGALHVSAYFLPSYPGDGQLQAVKSTAEDDDAGGRELTAIYKPLEEIQIVVFKTSTFVWAMIKH